MIEIVDFDAYNQEPTLSYGGNAGRKIPVPSLRMRSQQAFRFLPTKTGSIYTPCEFISSMQNEDCNAAVLRFIDKVDMAAIHKIIDDIPESAFGLTVITPVQKQYYKDVMDAVYYECLLPTSEKLRNVEAS